MTSRLVSADSLRMLPASFSAGPYFVAAALTFPAETALASRPLSDVERSATSAPVSKNTMDARSDAPSSLTRSRASATARAQRSP